VSLTARYLEENGIPTVIIGSALDIVTHCAVPRFLFTDLPLGNPLGIPGDKRMQQRVVDLALSLFESATQPNMVVKAPVRWSESDEWRVRYAQVKPEDRARLTAAGEARRVLRDQLKATGKVRDS
jgi:D-proline reductase (dithiol) PrdB